MKRLLTLACLAAGTIAISGGTTVADSRSRPAPTRAQTLDGTAFYTITTTINGKQVALTFVPWAESKPKTLTTNPSNARVELLPLDGKPAQLWQPNPEKVTPGSVYALYAKISDADNRLTGVLEVRQPDQQFKDDDKYRDKHNRVTVGYRSGETVELWHVTPLPNGKFRIASYIGIAQELNKPGNSHPTKWNEERSLAAVKVDGKVTLRHEKNADVPEQQWTFTRSK